MPYKRSKHSQIRASLQAAARLDASTSAWDDRDWRRTGRATAPGRRLNVFFPILIVMYFVIYLAGLEVLATRQRSVAAGRYWSAIMCTITLLSLAVAVTITL